MLLRFTRAGGGNLLWERATIGQFFYCPRCRKGIAHHSTQTLPTSSTHPGATAARSSQTKRRIL